MTTTTTNSITLSDDGLIAIRQSLLREYDCQHLAVYQGRIIDIFDPLNVNLATPARLSALRAIIALHIMSYLATGPAHRRESPQHYTKDGNPNRQVSNQLAAQALLNVFPRAELRPAAGDLVFADGSILSTKKSNPQSYDRNYNKWLQSITKSTDIIYLNRFAHTPDFVDYKPKLFLKFMADIFPDPIRRKYFQKLVGQSLLGVRSRRVATVLYGAKGGEGKSVLLGALVHAFAGECDPVDAKALLTRGNTAYDQDRTAMYNKLFCYCSELQSLNSTFGGSFDAKLLKDICGEEPHKYTGKYAPAQKVVSSGSLFITTNKPIRLFHADDATLKRLVGIKFDKSFRSTSEEDFDLLDKLKDEAPQILAWAVKGLYDSLCEEHVIDKIQKCFESDTAEIFEIKTVLSGIERYLEPAKGDRVKIKTLYRQMKSGFGGMQVHIDTFAQAVIHKFDLAQDAVYIDDYKLADEFL